ncbi:MAG: LysM peptidoglycan-binding domain-containing protein [Roseobacter sp.]
MSDKEASVTSGSTGLLTAGAVIALVAAAAAYLTLREDAQLSQDAVASLVRSTDQPTVKSAQTAPEDNADISTSEISEDIEPPVTEQSDVSEASQDLKVVTAAEPVVDEGEDDLNSSLSNEDVNENAADTEEAPSIDEVRVDEGGIIVVAGRAEPGSQVDILLDGEVVSTAEADAGGSFAALGTLQSDDAARTLTLRSDNGEAAVESKEEIILAPVSIPEEPEIELALAPPEIVEDPVVLPESVESEPAQETSVDVAVQNEIATQDDSVAETVTKAIIQPIEDDRENNTVAASELAQAAESEAQDAASELAQAAESEAQDDKQLDPQPDQSVEVAKVAEPAADVPAGDDEIAQKAAPEANSDDANKAQKSSQIAVLRSDDQGVSRVQTEASERVILDTISYNDAGVVQLSGRAEAIASGVRVYLNNQPVARLTVSAEGNWRGEVPGVEAGVYTLRLDAVSADGVISSRIETPFKRETPEVLVAAREGADGPARAITVQAGDTLWAIARDRYGEGVLYVQVFDANRNSIRDPDLIYPGQVFDLPAE